jgi:hypothetical protein
MLLDEASCRTTLDRFGPAQLAWTCYLFFEYFEHLSWKDIYIAYYTLHVVKDTDWVRVAAIKDGSFTMPSSDDEAVDWACSAHSRKDILIYK